MRWNKQKKSPLRNSQSRSNIGDRSYTYYKAQRHVPNTKPIEIKEPEHSRLRLLPSIIAALVIAGCLLFSLTLSTNPKVRFLQESGSPYTQTAEYEQIASEIMGRDIANRTKLTVNTSKVEQEVLERFPELNGAAISLPVLGRRPILTLSVREPALLLVSGDNVHVLDMSGYAVARAKDVKTEALKGLKTVRDQSGLDIQAGTQAVTTSLVTFLRDVEHQFRDKDLKISEITLPQSAHVVHIRLEGLAYFIKMDTGGDARTQAGSFLAAKGELERQGTVPAEYVDVRVEEKVFYK